MPVETHDVRRRVVVAAFLAVSLAISACAGSSKVTYEPPRSADGSQKIAILPIVIDISPADPADCMDSCSPEHDRADIVLAADSYLRSQLGYETVCFDFACRRIPDNPFSDRQLEDWSKELVAWSSGHADATQLPAQLTDVANTIGHTFDVDGIALLHGDIRYVQDADLAHWVATLTFSMYYNLARGNTAKIDAEIYSAEDGRKRWASKSTIHNIGNKNMTPPMETAKARYGEAIFGELEHSKTAR